MTRQAEHVFARFRLTEPWRYKAPALMSVVYLFLYTESVRFSDALLAVASALSTIAGIAGIGYLSNDVADRAADRQAGKHNGTLDMATGGIVALLIGFGAMALWPWVVFVPIDRIWITLLLAEFALFAAYSARPFRLKERGLLGPVSDALYAHANPALLAAYTMYSVTGRTYPHPYWLLGSLWSWQFFLGVRNILQHQITDADHDRASRTVTYVTRTGEEGAIRLTKIIVVPCEIASFAVWMFVTSLSVPILAAAFAVHVTATAIAIHQSTGRLLAGSLHERLGLFFDAFCLAWMPVALLAALTVSDWRMSALLVAHLVVFRSQLAPLFGTSFRAVRGACATCIALARRIGSPLSD